MFIIVADRGIPDFFGDGVSCATALSFATVPGVNAICLTVRGFSALAGVTGTEGSSFARSFLVGDFFMVGIEDTVEAATLEGLGFLWSIDLNRSNLLGVGGSLIGDSTFDSGLGMAEKLPVVLDFVRPRGVAFTFAIEAEVGIPEARGPKPWSEW